MEVLRNTARTLILCSIVVVSMGFAAEKGTFQPPSLKGYSFDKKFNIDWDEDGKIDTTIRNYKNSKGDIVAKFHKKGTNKIWACGIDSYRDDDSDITKNYTLVDTNNDGKFDTRYDMVEDMPLPNWVKQ